MICESIMMIFTPVTCCPIFFFIDYKPISVKYEYVGDLDYITMYKKLGAVFQRLQGEFEDTKGLIRIRIS
jgi:hypothetical protein